MPVKVTDKTALRGTSPCKGAENASKVSWGSQKGSDAPQAALAQKYTKKPYPVGGNGK